MSNSVTIRDVSRAAGVSISTVSFVVNGKADRYRIGQDTQDRVLAAVRQLGYQSTPIVNSGASQPVLAVSRDPGKPVDKICLVLSSASSPDSFSMILGLEPVLAAAGYQLVVSVIPIDPAAARERVIQLLKSGTTGMVCCPTVYSTVSAVVAKACLELGRTGCPVIVLWQGAGKAMVATLQGVNTELEAPSVAKPAVNTTPVVLPPTTPVSPAPRPVVPPPIINPVRPVVAPIAGVTVASPIIKQSPVLPVPVVIPAATPPIPELVVTPDPAPPPVIVQAPEPVLEPVPVVEPEPDIVEPPTPAPVSEPEVTPVQPAEEPAPVVSPEAPPPIPEPVVISDPAPPSVIVEAPEPVLEPVPVVEPEPDIVEPPTPAPVSEPEVTPVQPAVEPEPVVIPEAPPPTPEPVVTPDPAPPPVLKPEPEPISGEPQPAVDNQIEGDAGPVNGM